MSKVKNVEKAAERIRRAIDEKERIILISDSDLDGVTSLIVMEEAIKNLGGRVTENYFPDRGTEGYGLNLKAFENLKHYAPALFILTDLGIGNVKEIKKAKKAGFDVIIIDHHKVLEELPEADIIVDPKQPTDNYSFKGMPGCALVFKVVEELFEEEIPKKLKSSFLELVAIGILADRMPIEKDNKRYLEAGLSNLLFSFRPGICTFIEKYKGRGYSPKKLAKKIIRILQISEIKEHITKSYLLLTEPDEIKAGNLMEELRENNIERQKFLNDIFKEIIEKVDDKGSFIMEGRKGIPLNFAGSIASRVFSRFRKPVFIYVENGDVIRGSVRNPDEVDGVEALRHCSHNLLVYGGHAQASGFSLKKEKLEDFKECLKEYFS